MTVFIPEFVFESIEAVVEALWGRVLRQPLFRPAQVVPLD